MKIRARLLAIAILGLIFLLGPSLASANTASICDAVAENYVLNCGFEAGTYSSVIGGNTNTSVPVDWTPSAGFDLTPAGNHVTNNTSNVKSGSFALSIGNIDSQPLASLNQTLMDEAGGTYSGTFSAYDGGAGGDAGAFVTVSINGVQLVKLNDTASSYADYTFNFAGTGSDIMTISAQTNRSEWFVDDVSVQGGIVKVTPEPLSILLFGIGLLAIGIVTRKKLSLPTSC